LRESLFVFALRCNAFCNMDLCFLRPSQTGQHTNRFAFHLQTDVRIVFQPLSRYMARDAHDGLFAGTRLRKLSDRLVAHIVEAKGSGRALNFADISSALLVSAGSAGSCNRPQSGQLITRVSRRHAVRHVLMGLVGSALTLARFLPTVGPCPSPCGNTYH